MVGNHVIDRFGTDPAQADMGARLNRDTPRKAPAVAVEQRQRPQVDRVPPHFAVNHHVQRHQRRTPMVANDPLWVAGGARGIVQRNRIPFVTRGRRCIVGRPRGQQCGIIHRSDQRSLGIGGIVGIGRVVIVDHDGPRWRCHQRQRFGGQIRKLAVDDQHLGFGVVQLKGDGACVQTVVQRMQNRAIGH